MTIFYTLLTKALGPVVSLTADTEVVSSILAQSHTFGEIDLK